MKLLKEPLLHFLALGGMLFALHAVFRANEGTVASSPLPVIQITAADTDWLQAMWVRQWRRPPTDEELAGLVADHLKEEVLAREARELELDIGDTVVRRRLAQKMNFLLDDTIRAAAPAESELRQLYDTRPDLSRSRARISFSHIFFHRQQGAERRQQGAERAVKALATLSHSDAAPDLQGDRFLLGDGFAHQDEQALANLFGASFAKAVVELPVGSWSGPIESGYGLHLVKITELSRSVAQSFGETRERLVEEWRRERQEQAQAQLYDTLMRKYRLVSDAAAIRWLGPFARQAEVRR